MVSEVLTVPTVLGDVAVHLTGKPPSVAPGLLLLHANPGDHRDFDQIAPALAESWAVAAVDWPGYGQSSVSDPESVTADGLAQVAGQVCDALSDRGFHHLVVIGNSVGGYAAIRLAERNSQQIAGLVLVQSAGFTPVNVLTRAFFAVMSNRLVARMTVVPSARMYLGGIDRGGVRAAYQRAKQIPRDTTRLRVYRSVWRSFSSPRLDLAAERPQLADLPVQVVWGTRDPMNPWLISRMGVAKALPQAEITLLRSRHEPFCEYPQLFLDAVAQFLEQAREEP